MIFVIDVVDTHYCGGCLLDVLMFAMSAFQPHQAKQPITLVRIGPLALGFVDQDRI